MHDSAIKNFCVWARRELMSEVERRCALYDISEHPESPKDAQAVGGRVLSSQERRQRAGLLQIAHDEGYDTLVEQAAYTWFNRIMAIRFMEINDRLPSHTRLLSGNDGSFKPQVLAEALQVDIEGIDRAHVAQLVQSGDDEETFRYLFLAQCAELASCMPTVFSQVGSSMELLLPDGLLRKGSVIERMVKDIPEEDWIEGVEIVGWMYQYYVSERKDEYFASKRKATREDLAPATQLFTPEWIVRYLTENSLGRLWMLNRPDSALATRMEYYIVPDGDAETDFKRIESPEDITAVDPACGSGHILVYAFDLIAAMYEEEGYSRRDIPRLILEKNLTGLEIDPRAAAMASFALTMKACEYDSRFLRRGVRPRITVLSRIEFDENERDAIARTMKDQERLDAPFLLEQADLLDVLAHLDEAGSLFVPTEADLGSVRAVAETVMDEAGMFGMAAAAKAQQALDELEPLAKTYDVVIANPPYLKSGSMDKWLFDWVKQHYPDERNDLCTAFIARSFSLSVENSYQSLITMQSWISLGSFEKMRRSILQTRHIVALAHLGPHAFESIAGEVVATTATVFRNCTSQSRGIYFGLTEYSSKDKKRLLAEAAKDCSSSIRYQVNQGRFLLSAGLAISTYWFTDAMRNAFANGRELATLQRPLTGFQTGDADHFMKLWWEVSATRIDRHSTSRNRTTASTKPWVPCKKGGAYQKWFGNDAWIVLWGDDGDEIRKNPSSVIRNPDRYFLESISWTKISGMLSMRYFPSGWVFDQAGSSITGDSNSLFYLMALCNSCVAMELFKALSPTLTFGIGEMGKLPVLMDDFQTENVCVLSKEAVKLVFDSWSASETSPSFNRNTLFSDHSGENNQLAEAVYNTIAINIENRSKLRAIEETINSYFIGLYQMEADVNPEVDDGSLSISKLDETLLVKRLVSYAVGCIMGRYSLDKPGLVLANQGDGLPEYLQQVPEPSFTPDTDGIIPLTDIEYFHDDATGLFVDFMAAAFGEEHLEENLQFVADALGGTGTPRQVIRAYFRDGFFADHCKTYSVQSAGKRPIYWLFDSGKKGGFRALFYMHRYTPDLLARLRTEYVLPQQDRYRTQIDVIDDAMATADRREAADLRKRRKKLADQLAETVAYEEKVHHLADQMIQIDLDDGVKHNYTLFQDVLAKIK